MASETEAGELDIQLSDDEKEFNERGILVDKLFDFYNSPQYETLTGNLFKDSPVDGKKSALEEYIRITNGLAIGREPSPMGLATVRVSLGSDLPDTEAFTEWKPPRPAEELYSQFTLAAAKSIAEYRYEDAAAIIFQAVNLIHPFGDGNGRTSRLLLIGLLEPSLLKDKQTIDALVRADSLRNLSREISNNNLTTALAIIKGESGLEDLPFIMHEGVVNPNSPANLVQRLGAGELIREGALQRNTVIQHDNLSRDQQELLEHKTNEYREKTLIKVLETPSTRDQVLATFK